MQVFKNLISRWIKDDKKVLGRWTIDHCDKIRNKKVDLSNEDHCGPCGQYIQNKFNYKTDTKSSVRE